MRSMARIALVGVSGALMMMACDGSDPVDPPDVAVDMAIDMAPPDAAPPDALPPDAALAGSLSTMTPAVRFGLVGVGFEGTADLVLANAGPGPVQITALDGLDPPFSTNRALPIEVPAEAERTLVLTFAPEAEGPVEATLTVVSDSVGEPVAVTLSGEGALPSGELVGEGLDFGIVVPGEPTADFIEIRNTGVLPLDVYEVVGVEAPFSIPQGQVPTTADVELSARILVQFDPEGDGEWQNAVTVRTAAGDFEARIAGRALTPGELILVGVEPGWAPVDEPRRIVVHGGPFAAAPDAVTVGGVALEELELVDEWRVAGTLPAAGEVEDPALGPVDVRVDLGGGFGVLAGALVRTPPVADGMPLDLADPPALVEAAGNPWTVAGDTLAAGVELEVQQGAVLLFAGEALTVDGVLRAGGPDAPTVFSAAACAPDGWTGLRLGANETASSLNRVQVECTAAEGAAVRIDGQSSSLSRLTVRGQGGGCVALGEGSLVLIDADLTGCGGDGVELSPDATIARLQRSRIRGADWPVSGYAHNFGRLPIGAGHDWRGNVHDAIGLGPGFVGDVTLASQPAGVRYRIREVLRVARGLSLSLNVALVIDNPIEVEGRLTLPGGARWQAEAAGRIVVSGGGGLTAGGQPGEPAVIEARAPEGEPAPGGWAGVHIEGGSTLSGGHLTLRDGGADGPTLTLGGPQVAFPGLIVEDSADVGLEIGGDAELPGARFAGNPGGVRVTGGAGLVSGETADPAPAVRFAEGVDCAAWDTAELLDGAGLPAMVDCPGGEGEGEGEPPMP